MTAADVVEALITLLSNYSAPLHQRVDEAHLSKLILEGVEADEAAAKREEHLMDIGAAFILHDQAAEAVEPGRRVLHHSTMLPQALAGVDALAR